MFPLFRKSFALDFPLLAICVPCFFESVHPPLASPKFISLSSLSRFGQAGSQKFVILSPSDFPDRCQCSYGNLALLAKIENYCELFTYVHRPSTTAVGSVVGVVPSMYQPMLED